MVSMTLRKFASELADAARQVTLAPSAGLTAVGNTGRNGRLDPPGTEGDRTSKKAMRRLIEDAFPDHAHAGEEFGSTHGSSIYGWSLDPIDGTRSYTCGLPTWTTLIALLEAGQPVLGVIDAP